MPGGPIDGLARPFSPLLDRDRGGDERPVGMICTVGAKCQRAKSRPRAQLTYRKRVPLLTAFEVAGGPVGDVFEPKLRWEFGQH